MGDTHILGIHTHGGYTHMGARLLVTTPASLSFSLFRSPYLSLTPHMCMYVCMYVCMYIRMYVCMYVCMYVYTCIYIHIYTHVCIYTNVCVCVCVCACVCVCVCVYINIHRCGYTHMGARLLVPPRSRTPASKEKNALFHRRRGPRRHRLGCLPVPFTYGQL